MSDIKLNNIIRNVKIINNEWVCNEHPYIILEFYDMDNNYEYYACPECGNYIKVD